MLLYSTFRNEVPEHSHFWAIERRLRLIEGDPFSLSSIGCCYVLRGVEKAKFRDSGETEFCDSWDVYVSDWNLGHLVSLIDLAESEWSANRVAEREALDRLNLGGVICEDYSDLRSEVKVDGREEVIGDD